MPLGEMSREDWGLVNLATGAGLLLVAGAVVLPSAPTKLRRGVLLMLAGGIALAMLFYAVGALVPDPVWFWEPRFWEKTDTSAPTKSAAQTAAPWATEPTQEEVARAPKSTAEVPTRGANTIILTPVGTRQAVRIFVDKEPRERCEEIVEAAARAWRDQGDLAEPLVFTSQENDTWDVR